MKPINQLISIASITLVVGCVTNNSKPVIESAGVDMVQYETDLCECEQITTQVEQKADMGAAEGALVGGGDSTVFWITFDGLRWQEVFGGVDTALMKNESYTNTREEIQTRFWDEDPLKSREKLMPFFWSVMKSEGQLYGNRNFHNKVNVSNKQWFSYPGYNEILTGSADPTIQSNAREWNKNVTLLEYANQQKTFNGKVAAFASWNVFPYIINDERSGVPVNAGFRTAVGSKLTKKELLLNEIQGQTPSPWTSVRLDVFTHHYALEYIKKKKPSLVYIAYGETDDFAHNGDYDAYLNSAHRTDAFIRELWDFAQSHPKYKGKTSLIISTDHGRGTFPIDSWRSHGTRTKGSDQTWIAALGPGIKALGEVKENMQLSQNQLAQTVAKILGLDFKSQGTAVKTIVE